MGKKTKKTRWRTLTLNGHQSDSEESSSKSGLQTSKNYQHKYPKFPYSSQSTPIRKFQHDSSKSTRSNSTTSEHKATFNEDEYTRITTPRQDVLFKKGYLNKPKSYQTQTSTGTSSTANSTSTCTPDHQSADGTEGTDLEYESQFVFPNGFIDQNGIFCYINSFEPFPIVVYNAPFCYSEYPNSRSKRYSTDSMTESMSPHNEEASQDASQKGASERINNTPVFNQTYLPPSNYYYNGVCAATNGQYTEEPRRLKKRRRRKISRSKSNHEEVTSEGTDEYDSSDEVFSQPQDTEKVLATPPPSSSINHSHHLENHQSQADTAESHRESEERLEETKEIAASTSTEESLEQTIQLTENFNGGIEETTEPMITPNGAPEAPNSLPIKEPIPEEEDVAEETPDIKLNISDAQNLLLQSLLKNSEKGAVSSETPDVRLSPENVEVQDGDDNQNLSNHQPISAEANAKYSLKPDAEEFIPRTFRPPEALPFDPNVQFLNLPPNFIPIPFVNHLGELQRPPFLPPGIPINFVPPQDPKLLPSFVNVVPNGFVPKPFEEYQEAETQSQDVSNKPSEVEETPVERQNIEERPEEVKTPPAEVEVSQVKKPVARNEIDIAKIVYKLEEAAKQQRFNENKRQNYNKPGRYNSSRPYMSSRTRFNRGYQDKYPENRYQRSRPDSLEKRDRNYRKSEGFQRPKQSYEHEAVDKKSEAQMSEPRSARFENEKRIEQFDQSNLSQKHQERPNNSQRKFQRERDHVNNVNTRIGESCSIEKHVKLENTVNYSESLKKNVEITPSVTNSDGANKCPRFEKHNSEKVEKKAELKLSPVITPKPQRAQNQWISVSSRKKRKNKNSEEQQMMDSEEPEGEPVQNDDLFESFDVNQLVDVIPPSQMAEVEVDVKDDIAVDQSKTESSSVEEIITNTIEPNIVNEDHGVVSEIIEDPSKDPMQECAKISENSLEIIEIVPETIRNEEELSVLVEIPPLVQIKDDKTNRTEKKKQNERKKSKKGTQKPLTKRIIIKDVDLGLHTETPKDDVGQKMPAAVNENLPEVNKVQEVLEIKSDDVTADPEDAQVTLSEKSDIQSNEKPNEAAEVKPEPQIESHTASTNADKLNSPHFTQSESDTLIETPEKKSKKKKKKTPKPTLVKTQSVSSSSTTLNNLDDSYDFLLENSVVEEFDQKTNVEISQELDRIIQKGMYSSLEEKIKALKINAIDDGFFKTINFDVLHSHTSAENQNSIKAPNFGRILKNTTQLLKTPNITEDVDNQSLIDIDFSKIKLPDLEPQPSTSKSGIFLENPIVNELIKENAEVDPSPPSIFQGKSKSNGKLKNKSKKNQPISDGALKPAEANTEQSISTGEDLSSTIEQESKHLSTSKTFSYREDEPPVLPTDQNPLRKTPPKQDSLYPITQAVKDWMTKTRENTPDVEILKSPNTIYKEFYGSETETESETIDSSKNESGDPPPAKSVSRQTSPMANGTKDGLGARVCEVENVEDEEITIWSVPPQNGVDQDLLECWENDLTNGCEKGPEEEEKVKLAVNGGINIVKKHVIIPNGDIKEIKGSVQNGQAYLNDHVEEGEDAIEVYESKYGKNEDFLRLKAEIEEKQKNLNFPRHGNLPYRAICCSIM